MNPIKLEIYSEYYKNRRQFYCNSQYSDGMLKSESGNNYMAIHHLILHDIEYFKVRYGSISTKNKNIILIPDEDFDNVCAMISIIYGMSVQLTKLEEAYNLYHICDKYCAPKHLIQEIQKKISLYVSIYLQYPERMSYKDVENTVKIPLSSIVPDHSTHLEEMTEPLKYINEGGKIDFSSIPISKKFDVINDGKYFVYDRKKSVCFNSSYILNIDYIKEASKVIYKGDVRVYGPVEIDRYIKGLGDGINDNQIEILRFNYYVIWWFKKVIMKYLNNRHRKMIMVQRGLSKTQAMKLKIDNRHIFIEKNRYLLLY
ncbi:Hypothetical protein ORPV_607 [Orpheovirus IHUMI-LCC2]|uniref:BTB domain-containing protein n=1 Tax=Orpheovirus IHUMI-LCC2 TaxID=2023057 RepID=A0A2I2L4R7_9VIRU|nr:Hypothetical protein ORPV_607 [Orpheovirus IHUMI-LCC2]SNW62511.1 Hypothetical protein ORPV_607 [Orpheovirus IHUMI-LCC2]